MVLNQFMAASPKAKVLNSVFFLFNLLGFISCCIGFGSGLMTSNTQMMGGSMKATHYWNHLHVDGSDNIAYDSPDCALSFCDKCKTGGRGFIAMQVFAFLPLLVVLALSTIRILGLSVSALEPTRKSLFVELVATAMSTFFFFLSVCVYGGTCFHAVGAFEGTSVVGTGFGFTIAVFFFLVINCVVLYNIRSDSSTHLGSSAGSDYTAETDPNTTSYNPPASYQYNANAEPNAAAYAGSYNGDVMPAAQQGGQADNNL